MQDNLFGQNFNDPDLKDELACDLVTVEAVDFQEENHVS